EDGIRDGHVTGVQTCALPIFNFSPQGVIWDLRTDTRLHHSVALDMKSPSTQEILDRLRQVTSLKVTVDPVFESNMPDFGRLGPKIGRASCRERVSISEGAG